MTEVFPKAPITEALIDVRTQLPQDVSLDKLEALHDWVRVEYPEKQKRTMWEGLFELKNEKDPLTTSRHQLVGYLFRSADGTQAVQFRLDGFTFSRLRPYTRWEQVFSEAKRLWDIYRVHAKPVRVNRLATRYINSIEIPFKKFDYDDYFTMAPKMPNGLPQVLTHFFTRVVVPFPEEGVTAIIAQTPSEKPDPIKSSVILDIDVFKEVSLSPEDAKIDEILAILRKVKNAIFFGSITPKTKELFR
ncbi:MAG TPA: TIGR04255 family protein [Terriglobia bacterium]|nr:TIGR04255 family protein [Terriglobia bacterium]